MKPNIVWWSGRGSWDCCTMLNELFHDCEHHDRKWLIDRGYEQTQFGYGLDEGCVVILHGGNEQLYGRGPTVAQEISHAVSGMKWVIFVNIGDEAAEFCVNFLEHPNSRLWLQTPNPSQRADRYLIEGWSQETRKYACPMMVKNIDIFFAGQDTHQRRHDCIAALRGIESSVVLTTHLFGTGLRHEDYFYYMSRAKLVACPSGPATPDSFRMAEALECGAIPIIDAVSLNPTTRGFWDRVLPNSPLTVVEDWSTLPEVVRGELENYEQRRLVVSEWWAKYKSGFFRWLDEDIHLLALPH